MASTIFVTYQFEGAPYSADTSYGYSTPIHCNYIEKIETDSLINTTISLIFDNDEFPFLADNTSDLNISGGTGWTAWKLNALIQIINATGDTAIPDPAAWKIIDITNQTVGWVSGETIQKSGLTSTIYSLTIPEINAAPTYDLSYLNYPTKLETDRLAWGEEAFFFGNVKTDIKATAYTTDIPVVMPLNQFNSTTNPTWNGSSAVSVSEVGIYDSDGNLVAVGKLNNPINKDSTIARTILFAMDF
jgi:hypothetical protein